MGRGVVMRILICAGVVLLSCIGTAFAAVDCSPAALARKPLELPGTVAPPISGELQVRNAQLGMPSGVLAAMQTPEQSLERVLQRLRIDGCQDVAAAVGSTPAPAAAVMATSDPAAYKPQTAFDNTPWRFDMSQNGKRMTAEEFDAWMKSRGVRVVQARPAVTTGSATQEETQK